MAIVLTLQVSAVSYPPRVAAQQDVATLRFLIAENRVSGWKGFEPMPVISAYSFFCTLRAAFSDVFPRRTFFAFFVTPIFLICHLRATLTA